MDYANLASLTPEDEVLAERVKVSCPNWGANNNYPLGLSGKKVVCGRCKYPLPEPGCVFELSAGQASSFFQKSKLPVLVDFFSPTCAPCHMMHSVVENLAKRRAGETMPAEPFSQFFHHTAFARHGVKNLIGSEAVSKTTLFSFTF